MYQSKQVDKTSKMANIKRLIEFNPNLVFNNREICKAYNNQFNGQLSVQIASMALYRLYNQKKVFRTRTQLKEGYVYSLDRRRINERYKKHILPYAFNGRVKLIKELTRNKFPSLKDNKKIVNYLPINSSFVKKYGLNYFLTNKVTNFIATNIGFLLCDGHIRKHLQQVQYFFYRKEDAQLFKSQFLSIFKKEYLSLNFKCGCYEICICNKDLASLFHKLGVPKGNKVYQPFLIPSWVYEGSQEIKKRFLSIMFGSEGSKPQDNRWRIQFVLSKSKEYVPNLIEFVNQMRTMLNSMGISSSHIQLRKQKKRAFSARFYVKGKEDLINFYNELEFSYASEKQECLKSLIIHGKS